jgi:hypothetical protein
MGDWVLTSAGVVYDGRANSDVENDPHQWRNLWSGRPYRGRRADRRSIVRRRSGGSSPRRCPA